MFQKASESSWNIKKEPYGLRASAIFGAGKIPIVMTDEKKGSMVIVREKIRGQARLRANKGIFLSKFAFI